MTDKELKKEFVGVWLSEEQKKIIVSDAKRVGVSIGWLLRDSYFGSQEFSLSEYKLLLKNLKITLRSLKDSTEKQTKVSLRDLRPPGPPPKSLPQAIVSEEDWVVSKKKHKQLEIPTSLMGQGTKHDSKIVSEIKNLINLGKLKKII